MSFTDAFEQSVMALIFNATAIANLADNAGSLPLTTLKWSLHTGSPGETGNQSSSEANFGSYARQSVARTSGGHSVSGGVVSPVANIDFPQATSGSNTITHCGVGSDAAGTGNLYVYGTVTPNLSVSTDVTARLTTSTTISLL